MPHRSAVTGEYVTDEYANQHPDTTVYEENQMTETTGGPDPYEGEPAEEDLPDKPPIEDMPDEDEDPPTEEEEAAAEAEIEFLDPATAEQDDSVDNAETEETPRDDVERTDD